MTVKVSDMTEATSLDSADLLMTVDDTTSKKITMANLSKQVANDIADGASIVVNASNKLQMPSAGLIMWVESQSYEMTSITRNDDGIITSATVKWPDGSAGTFTTTTINTTFGSIDAYTISHADSSKTVTQSAVTRNSLGDVTAKPTLTIA
jgi:hypothetical protein